MDLFASSLCQKNHVNAQSLVLVADMLRFIKMIKSFETDISNKSVQNDCSGLYRALNASGRYG